MEHHAGVLQQRIEVAPLHRAGQQTQERIRCEQHEQQQSGADGPHHAEHARDERQWQAAAEASHGHCPQRQHQRPQQHRSLMAAPYRRHAVDQRQRAVRVRRHVKHAEVVVDEGVCQREVGRDQQRAMQEGSGPCKAHPRQHCRAPRHHRQRCQHQRHEHGQDQCEVAQFRIHRVFSVGLSDAARLSASAASGGM